jgi:hypothetical protein
MGEEHCLLERLSELLMTDQADKVKLNVLWTLSNLIAEPDQKYRNEVLRRTKLIDFFDAIAPKIPKIFLTQFPWVLSNLFKGGLTFETKKEQVVSWFTYFYLFSVDELLEAAHPKPPRSLGLLIPERRFGQGGRPGYLRPP